MKVLNNIRNLYEKDGLFTQNKAVTLYVLTLVLLAGFTAFGAIRFVEGSWTVAVGEILVAAIFGFSAFLIRRGHFSIASILTHSLAMVAAVAIFLLRNPSGPLSIYLLPSFMFPIYVLAPMIAHARWQIWLNIGAMVVAETLVYLVKRQEVHVVDYAILLVLIAMSSFILDQLFVVQTKTMKAMEAQANHEKRRTGKFTQLIKDMREGFNVGQGVMKNAQETQGASNELRTAVERMGAVLDKTGHLIREDRASTLEIGTAEEKLKQLNQVQIDAVKKSSQVNQSMAAQIRNLAQTASAKVEAAGVMVQKSSQAGVQMEKTLTKLTQINRGAQNILAVIAVIEDIAARTNLLAMNASIEAAHAGGAGKGFAVVANEIRRLAQEADSNSKAIKAQLQESFQDLELLSTEGQTLGDAFKILTEGSRQMGQEIGDLGQGLEGLSQDTNQILTAVEDLKTIGTEVQGSIDDLVALTEQHRKQIEEIETYSEELKAKVQGIEGASLSLQSSAQTLTQIGQENLSQIQQLEKGMEELEKA